MKDLLEKVSKKTLILVGGFFILIFIVIFGGALLYNKLFYKFSYSEVENIMKEAAISYLDDNSEKLPLNINDSITIPEDSLVNANKMKSIKDLLKNGNDSCNGEVIVTNINNTYRYNPILSCENEYESMAHAVNPYGDGEASRRTVEAILYHFGMGEKPEDLTKRD